MQIHSSISSSGWWFVTQHKQQKSQPTKPLAHACMMHLCVISIIAPRAIFLSIGANFPQCALANNRLSATLAFLPRKTSFLRMHLLEISKGQVSGAATADLSYKVLQPIQRLNATRNSIHMHYVHFSCSLVLYIPLLCAVHTLGSQCIKQSLACTCVFSPRMSWKSLPSCDSIKTENFFKSCLNLKYHIL
jgi:hypothetical protein